MYVKYFHIVKMGESLKSEVQMKESPHSQRDKNTHKDLDSEDRNLG